MLLLFILFVSWPHAVLSVESDFKPLSLYLSDDPYILGTGGLDLGDNLLFSDLYRPSSFINRPGHFTLQYKDGNVVHLRRGDWNGSSAEAITKEGSGLLPLTLPFLGRSALAFSYKDFRYIADAQAEDGSSYRALHDYTAGTVALGVAPFSFLHAGAGRETYRDHDDWFYETALIPAEGMSLNYRCFRREMHLQNAFIKEGDLAELTLDPSENVREFSLHVAVPGELTSVAVLETGNPENREFLLKIFPTRFSSLKYYLRERELDLFDKIMVNSLPEGHITGNVDYSNKGMELEIYDAATRYVIAVRETSFKMTGSGKISGSSVLSFWEDLLAGDRYYTLNLDLPSLQYNLGVESKTTDKLITRGGLQYIIVKGDGEFRNWTPYPLFNIGRLDEQVFTPEYRKAVLGVVAFGFTYRLNAVEFTYGFGQIIPIKLYKKEDEGSEGGGGGGRNESTRDKIKHDPGGNIHSIKAAWYF